MIFPSEEIRTEFHKLPFQKQLAFSAASDALAAEGLFLWIIGVGKVEDSEDLEVDVRVVDKYEKVVIVGVDL